MTCGVRSGDLACRVSEGTNGGQGAPSLPLEVQATSDSMYWSGTGTGFPEVEARVYTLNDLPQAVVHDDNREFSWEVRAAGTSAFYDLGDIGVPFWVTWTSPGVNHTARRVDFATKAAEGATGIMAAADSVWDQLAEPAEPPEGAQEPFAGCELVDTWDLLDGGDYAGECHDQANLMVLVLHMAGFGACNVRLVYGSYDIDCQSMDTRGYWNGQGQPPEVYCTNPDHQDSPEWLLLRMANGWNDFEGCCWVGDGQTEMYYALWPPRAQPSALEMLRDLPLMRESWCFMYYDGYEWWVDEECEEQELP